MNVALIVLCDLLNETSVSALDPVLGSLLYISL